MAIISEFAARRTAPRPSVWLAPPELDRSFRLIAFDWDGTAVASRSADAARPSRLIDELLGAGAHVAVVTGTSLQNVTRQLASFIQPANARRLLISTNRGSEVFGFDRRAAPTTLWKRQATPEEDLALTAAVEEARARLERVTGLELGIVYDRLNRRKLDLIPEPAWTDPPKSEIGALLSAVEARLRDAGLRGGLREAFELTERLAREMGLVDPRVTSDVKHIELGLTDKSDAIAYLMTQIAEPLSIAPSDVLLLGDEFGPIGGFEGSDHRMLAPAARGAVVVSVGPEPGGAPENVLHLGGGPDRFCEILEQQLALGRRLGPFAPPRDAAWAIEESGFDVAREHEIESLLAIANGYVGSRGSIAEGTSVSRPATFLAGAFEPSNDVSRVPELVIAPDWGRLRFVIEGEPFNVERSEMLRHRRVLDLRRGVLLRESLSRDPCGHVTQLRTLHAASLADPHVLLEGVELTPHNFTGSIHVDAMLSGEVKSASGATHWTGFQARADGPFASLVGRTAGGLTACLTSHTRISIPGEASLCDRGAGSTWVSERCTLPVRLAETTRLFRTVTIHTSRDVPDVRAAGEALRAEIDAVPPEQLLDRHVRAWAERWRRADVQIDGAPRIERALRFALYHLIAAVNPRDPRCSVGARALSGEAYRGHVFWDTEIFMLPFYDHCYPEAARSLLEYRYRTLDGARRKASALGYRGALYAWESAETGDECTPSHVVSPFGHVMRVLSGEQEHHIAADVAFAVRAYERATGDLEFASAHGLEILIETARFWVSRAVTSDGLAHVLRVIGPDEYHEAIDDNAFTNWLARENLLSAASAVRRWRDAAPAKETLGRLDVRPEEVAAWERLAGIIYLGHDARSGLIEQFVGFHRLEPIDLGSYEPRNAPMDVLLGRERTQASQVVKQADVVQLIALVWDQLTPAARLANFLYYEPRTSHGSSLSPGIHALVAARLGLADTAMRYLEQAAEIDLGNNMGNSAGGVHAAGMGSLWQAVVFGCAGVRPAPDSDETLVLSPRLPPSWRHLAFPLGFRGAWLGVHVERDMVEVGVEGEHEVRVRLGSARGAHEVVAVPGRRYVARLEKTDDPGGPPLSMAGWEEAR